MQARESASSAMSIAPPQSLHSTDSERWRHLSACLSSTSLALNHCVLGIVAPEPSSAASSSKAHPTSPQGIENNHHINGLLQQSTRSWTNEAESSKEQSDHRETHAYIIVADELFLSTMVFSLLSCVLSSILHSRSIVGMYHKGLTMIKDNLIDPT